MSKYNVFIIEGIDRLGKDTLIEGIQQKLGHFFVLHYSKPKKLEVYQEDLKTYQFNSFDNGFKTIFYTTDYSVGPRLRVPLIFNRFHLGEAVYSPMYRKYDGDYVFDFEKIYGANSYVSVKLILLTTSDFSFIQDDGESFDFSKKEQEQDIFKTAFERSIFKNKQIIDVARNGQFRPKQEILEEALS